MGAHIKTLLSYSLYLSAPPLKSCQILQEHGNSCRQETEDSDYKVIDIVGVVYSGSRLVLDTFVEIVKNVAIVNSERTPSSIPFILSLDLTSH